VVSDLATLRATPVCRRDGSEAPLGSYLDGPTLLVFLRHFGCIGCAAHVEELLPRLDELVAAGLQVVFVGNGAANFIDGFVDRFGLGDRPIVVVSDPTLRAHHLAGLQRSWWGTLGPSALVDLIRLKFAGLSGSALEGDAAQLGGLLLLDGRGDVVLQHRARSLGDHLPTSDVIDAALSLMARKSPVLV
jgi:hypothetical protein